MPSSEPAISEVRETPSFEGLLNGGPPKDAEVIIREEGAGSKLDVGRKRTRSKSEASHNDAPSITVLCHQLVLYSFSRFFQNKLDRWGDAEGTDSGRKQLQLIVPPGQQELGQRLITAMYADQPDLSDLNAQQLVQLALLAESYDVGKVVAAAARSLGQLQREQLTPEVYAAVFALPESCLKLNCFQAVKARAAEQLRQQYGDRGVVQRDPSSAKQLLQLLFGDLEEVWAHPTQAEQLLALPYAAILQLVQVSDTKVASEDTIVYTLGRWLEEHLDTSSEQKEQLADTVRLPLCTATFLSSTDAMAWLLDGGYTQRELSMACLLHGSRQQQQQAAEEEEEWEAPVWVEKFEEQRAAWQKQRRHRSSRRTAEIKRKVPLADVRGLMEKEAEDGQRHMRIVDSSTIWHGRELMFCLTLDDEDGDLVLFITSGDGSYASLFSELQASCTSGGPLVRRVKGSVVGPRAMLGWLKLVHVANPYGEWAPVEAALRQKHLVHADGCLHLQATITCIE